MAPMRELCSRMEGDLSRVERGQIPPISFEHFQEAIATVRSTVPPNELNRYMDWNTQYGSFKQIEALT